MTHTFTIKSGRRLVDQEDIAYILPSDKPEVTRLNLNHQLWKCVIGSLYHSPIHQKLKEGIRVLDIGCGPGWWTIEMARCYPRSQFFGVDMADIFITENQPSNVTFKIANAAQKLDFEDGHFDFVFLRFLVMGFPTEQYISSLKEITRVLKPGGSMEILELINRYENGGSALNQISDWIHQALDARKMDSFIAEKIPGYLKNIGYQQVESKLFNLPLGPWGGDIGQLHLDVQKYALPAVGAMITELAHVNPSLYKKTIDEAFGEINSTQTSTSYRLICAAKKEN